MNAMEQKVLLATDGPEDLPFAVPAENAPLHALRLVGARAWQRRP